MCRTTSGLLRTEIVERGIDVLLEVEYALEGRRKGLTESHIRSLAYCRT
jgi:hypothetical protein